MSAMEKLTTDMRFTMYNIFYKRILVIWIFTAFMILLGILFSKQIGLVLFGLGVAWLICNAMAIFLCMWVKLKLNKSLEKCLASVNAGLVKHNLLLALDDRGKISCHKVNLCFIYLNNTQCIVSIKYLTYPTVCYMTPIIMRQFTSRKWCTINFFPQTYPLTSQSHFVPEPDTVTTDNVCTQILMTRTVTVAYNITKFRRLNLRKFLTRSQMKSP